MKKVTCETYNFYRNYGGKFLESYIHDHLANLISDQEFVARCNAVTGNFYDYPSRYDAWNHLGRVA